MSGRINRTASVLCATDRCLEGWYSFTDIQALFPELALRRLGWWSDADGWHCPKCAPVSKPQRKRHSIEQTLAAIKPWN